MNSKNVIVTNKNIKYATYKQTKRDPRLIGKQAVKGKKAK
jgi:hypothetical protein